MANKTIQTGSTEKSSAGSSSWANCRLSRLSSLQYRCSVGWGSGFCTGRACGYIKHGLAGRGDEIWRHEDEQQHI